MSESAKKILLVADYGKHDLAFKEVTQRLYALARDAGLNVTVDIVSVDPFNTAQTAAIVEQAAADGRYDMIYHNTAPRKDTTKARHNNDGEGLIFARYKGDKKETLIVGVNSGNAETINTSALLTKSRIPDGVFEIDCPTKGSQFRSRDVFPPHVIKALNGTIVLKEQADIPEHTSPDLETGARAFARTALAETYDHQLAHHGDSAKGYVTIIGHTDDADKAIPHIAGHHPDHEVDFLALKSKKNAWIEAGFAAAQLALNSDEAEKRTIILLPDKGALDNSQLYEATLDNGARILSSDLEALYFVRSRVASADFKLDDLKRVKLPTDITPAYTDGYGNVKLAITHNALVEKLGYGDGDGKTSIGVGERGVTAVRVNGREVDAYVGNPNANGSFAVHDGEFALSSGSSGWAPGKGDTQKQFFAEIFLRGGNASQALDIPQPGDSISIQKKRNQSVAPGSALGSDQVLEAHFPVTTKIKGV